MARATNEACAAMLQRCMDTRTVFQVSPQFSHEQNMAWISAMISRMVHYSDYPWKHGVTEDD